MKEDGLVNSLADYMALDERVMGDWRMYREALARRQQNEARRQGKRR